ncbi:hypothetical protein [Streptomyces sp. NPDC056844]|uniref:hypothetical protein n=1 Tax=unclassified Streptomyces TaxID=2593676 RepID=UPI0036B5DF39
MIIALCIHLQGVKMSAQSVAEAKIKELEEIHRTDGQALHGGMAHDFVELLKQAKAGLAEGDLAKATASADRAKMIYNKARAK